MTASLTKEPEAAKKQYLNPTKDRAIWSLCAGYASGSDCKTWRTQAGQWSSFCSLWLSNCALCIPDTAE
jgi:hypothetical protein